jgi:hypothetical protein
MRIVMPKSKKPWVTPRVKLLEPTPEILELFAEQLAERRPAEVRLKRTG